MPSEVKFTGGGKAVFRIEFTDDSGQPCSASPWYWLPQGKLFEQDVEQYQRVVIEEYVPTKHGKPLEVSHGKK